MFKTFKRFKLVAVLFVSLWAGSSMADMPSEERPVDPQMTELIVRQGELLNALATVSPALQGAMLNLWQANITCMMIYLANQRDKDYILNSPQRLEGYLKANTTMFLNELREIPAADFAFSPRS